MRRGQVKATVHLAGLGPGEEVWTDLDDPMVARWIRGGMLRVLDEPQVEVEAVTDAVIISEPQPEVERPPTSRPSGKHAPVAP